MEQRNDNPVRRHHGAMGPRGMQSVPQSALYQGRFGRMFRNLPSLELAPEESASLAERMTVPEDQDASGASGLDNDKIPAGYTYLGQFIDHDITFDPTSKLQRDNDPDALRNFRTPRFDLDCVYGSGPADNPFLYEQPEGVRMLVGENEFQDEAGTAVFEDDLPRTVPRRVEGESDEDRRNSRHRRRSYRLPIDGRD